jgi:hypothetical protein
MAAKKPNILIRWGDDNGGRADRGDHGRQVTRRFV